ncbi:MAG: nitrilase [Methanomicrobiales archaeon HGW-Methanomicrobiales-5]|nr:MAG: nitrilase [Methanomicrobiales archaeon HGW-Methanomicrobiales-5]
MPGNNDTISDPGRTVRICIAQLSPVWEDPEKTLEKADGFITHAAICGAQLICFPEQFATGWDPQSGKNVQDVTGGIVTRLQACAKANRIAVIGSFREASSPFPKNTSIAIGNDGSILSTYSKIHLFSPAKEDEHFIPGTDLGIFSLGPITCSLAICYDLRFPELFRIYTQKGVQAVFVPAAWPKSRIRHWELFIQARAAENQMYVIGVNTTGTTPVDQYSGSSIAADPHGTIISRANEAEQLLFIDLDPAEVTTARTALPVEKDRKDTLYQSLLKTK